MSRDSTHEIDSADIPRTPGDEDNLGVDESVNAGIDPRQAQMNDLVQRRREERAQEEGGQSDVITDELGDDPDGLSGDPAENTPQSKPEEPQEEVYSRDGKRYMRLKVDGEEQEFELGHVKATAQKNLAADKRLAAAAARERDIQEKERILSERELALQQVQSKPPELPGASDDVESQVDAALSAIYSGDEDQAKKALIGLVAGRQQPTQNAYNPDDIDKRVQQATLAAIAQQERQREIVTAASKFEAEFNDIASDPELWAMADKHTLEIVDSHPEYTPYQIMQEAGNRVRGWLDAKKGNGLSDRTQRKRQAMTPVSGANRPASLGKDEPAPKTRRDVIGDMKRARGQLI